MVIFFEDSVKYNIPLNEYYLPNQSSYKGVIFFIHGFESSKDFGVGLLPKRIAELGFFVVSIDAYKHGLRRLEPFISGDDWIKAKSIFEVIDQTTQDILTLYKEHYHHISSVVGVSGISMGAMVAYQMPRLLPEVTFILPFIGTPNLEHLLQIPKYRAITESMSKADQEMIQTYCKKLDLSTNLLCYSFVHILACLGEVDPMISYQDNADFIHQLQLIGNEKASIKTYPIAHQVSEEMILDGLKFIQQCGEMTND
jgi:uncharacterized protein